MAPVITIIGSLNIDLVTTTQRIPSGGETLTATSFSTGPGGKGANQAVACARLSRPNPFRESSKTDVKETHVIVKMIGAVGSDEFGPRLISGLEGDGIDTSRIEVVEGQTTGVAVILVEEQTGENRILLSPGANHALQPCHFTTVSSLGSEKPDLIILQLEIPLMTVLSILHTAKEAGIAVLLNPAPAVELPDDTFRDLDHLILNESEAVILSGLSEADIENQMGWSRITDIFLRKGVRNVVVTLGAKGAYASRKLGEGVFVEAPKGVKVVDTTAAGDTFVGAYAVDAVKKMRGEWDMEATIRWACQAAARTVEKKGAQSAIPWADEINITTARWKEP
jgi:ribokinase